MNVASVPVTEIRRPARRADGEGSVQVQMEPVKIGSAKVFAVYG